LKAMPDKSISQNRPSHFIGKMHLKIGSKITTAHTEYNHHRIDTDNSHSYDEVSGMVVCLCKYALIVKGLHGAVLVMKQYCKKEQYGRNLT